MNLTPTRSSAIRRSATVLAALSLGVAALSGCSSDDDATDTSTTVASAQDTTTTAATDGELTMTGAWARTSPMMASNGAIYMEITNATDADDALLSVSVDPSIAATAELHETRAAGGDMGGDMGGAGGEISPEMLAEALAQLGISPEDFQAAMSQKVAAAANQLRGKRSWTARNENEKRAFRGVLNYVKEVAGR